MFASWGRQAVRLRWLLLVAGLAVMVIGIVWGSGVFGVLSSTGFDDPHSESARAAQSMAASLSGQSPDVVVLYSSLTATVDDPELRHPVVSTVDVLRSRPEVAHVFSYYDRSSPAFVSRDRRATY